MAVRVGGSGGSVYRRLASSAVGLLPLLDVTKVAMVAAAHLFAPVVAAARGSRPVALAPPAGRLVVGGVLETDASRSPAMALARTWARQVASEGRANTRFSATELAAYCDAPQALAVVLRARRGCRFAVVVRARRDRTFV